MSADFWSGGYLTKAYLFKALVSSKLHERVRGGYRLARLLARDMVSVPIPIEGHAPLHVDLRRLDEHALSLYRAAPLDHVPHEPALTELFQRLIRPDDVVYDVGANLGLHTLTFAKLAREVVTFEPNPSLLPNLRRTVAQLPNARLIECCLSESDGTVEFHISDWDHMLSSMSNWTGQPTQSLRLPARAIDSLLAEGAAPRPQVLKVDVEGAELLVFSGAEGLLNAPDAPRFIVFEELNGASRELGIADGAAAEYLRAKGYTLYLIGERGLAPLAATRHKGANLLAAKTAHAGLVGPLDLP